MTGRFDKSDRPYVRYQIHSLSDVERSDVGPHGCSFEGSFGLMLFHGRVQERGGARGEGRVGLPGVLWTETVILRTYADDMAVQ